MKEFLVDLRDQQDFQLKESEIDVERPMQSHAAERLGGIRMWSKVCDNVTDDELRDVRRVHEERLSQYRG